MSEEWEYIDIFEPLMNLFALPFFIIGFIYTLFIYRNKKSASRAILTLLMFGGCLFSFGEILELFYSEETLDALDELGDSFNIFLASILLVLGFIVILEQKLKVSEEKFRHLFENSPYSVVLLEINGIIIDCNIATDNLFEIKRNKLIGCNFSELFHDSKKLTNLLKERVELMNRGKILKPLELQYHKKNNLSIWVSLQTSLIELDNETFMQYILEDITERKKAESIIKEEVKRLKNIDKIRGDFIRRTSHELKTPLISIYSSTQYLLENHSKEMNEDMLNLIKSINRGGERLKRLAENLLDVFNLETNILTLKMENIDLVKIINDVVKDFSTLLKKRTIALKLNLNGPCSMQADKIRIEQVVMNLLSNAMKNTPPNGLIYISLNKKSEFIDIIIKDSGIGFTEAEKEKVFEKFGKIERKNVDNDIIIEGSGLGLYISKQIVELHNGKIWVESEGRNKGSTFMVRIPIK